MVIFSLLLYVHVAYVISQEESYLNIETDSLLIAIPDTLDFTYDWWGMKPITIKNNSENIITINNATEPESPFSFEFEYFQTPISLAPQDSVNIYISCCLDTLADFSQDIFFYYSHNRVPDSLKTNIKENKPQEAQIQKKCAEITEIKGFCQVKVTESEGWIDAEVGMIICSGTMIFTDIDSALNIKFGDNANCTVYIGELSTITLDKYFNNESIVRTRLKVRQGLIRVKVTEQDKEIKTDMKVKTPNYSASPAGTVFSVEYDSLAAVAVFEVFDDTVNVTRKFYELDTLRVVGNGHGQGQRLTVYQDGGYFYEDLNDLGIKGEVSGIWDPLDGFFIVTDNITIPVGDTLIIHPNVDVEFNSADSLSGDFDMSDGNTEACFLKINGTLIAQGTLENPINFKRFDQQGEWDDSYKWGTIYFSPLSGYGSLLSYVKINDAYHIVDIAGYDASGAISFNESSASIVYSEISSNFNNGIFCDNGSSPILTNLSIVNNFSAGIKCYNISNPVILNTIIWGNEDDFSITDFDSPTLSYSLVEGSTLPDQVIDLGNNLIGYDPLFTDPENGYYFLSEDSPCIDTGDPLSPFDPDDTIADMGAYYYDQILIPIPPYAEFSSDIVSGYNPLSIDYYDLSTQGSGSIIEWLWDFGNEDTSTLQNPTCIYNDPGYYTVSLTVTDTNDSIDTKVKEDYITVYADEEPLPPDNVQIQIIENDAHISWDEVTTTIYGNPTSVDYYIIFYSEIANQDSLFFYLDYTDQTQYIHPGVTDFSDQMFYKIESYIGDLRGIENYILKIKTEKSFSN